ncbi:TraB domain containing 2B [Willisornis vidua]|uniref:Metalloprotease TIKI n=1 Tax=Willisornis vidua TaxID=1566151 RepID=A0ABQ9CT04_9PASS|nr:TraB domain containing 2B [Willisornis vidua]
MDSLNLAVFTSCFSTTHLQGELNSFLWTIRRDPPAYLFGTIHVPYTRVWDFIPDNSKAAFHASSSVYFELDLTDPYTISGLASCQMLPHGENLQDVLPRELYRRLKRHLDYIKLMLPHWMTPDQRGKGLYADYLFNAIAGNWERKRPVWVMLMVNSLTETDIRSRGVPVLDLYLAQEAERMKKKTGAVERVEEQCHPLNGLNFSQASAFELDRITGLKHLKSSSIWLFIYLLLENWGRSTVRYVTISSMHNKLQSSPASVCLYEPELSILSSLKRLSKEFLGLHLQGPRLIAIERMLCGLHFGGELRGTKLSGKVMYGDIHGAHELLSSKDDAVSLCHYGGLH